MRLNMMGAGAVVVALVLAVSGPAPAAPLQDAADAPASAESEQSRNIRFSFKGATFEQVIDFFSRTTGLPVIWEAEPPAGTLDYLSPEPYSLDEGLRVLNIILQAKGVSLRVSDDMLYLQKLSDMQKRDVPVYIGEIPAKVTPNDIVTVVRPLNVALAKPLSERLAAMVAEYGSVTAIEQQNALVITETAAQIRRLLTIVEQLDRDDIEGAIEIFPIRHANATAIMEPLKALMSVKEVKYVINQKGEQVKLEEDQLEGLNITADERTNSIVAKGTQTRIEKLREVIELLDVPSTRGGRTIRTITLLTLAPAEAVSRLNAMYARLPDEKKPTVIALDEIGKVTLVGDDTAIAEGTALLREIDGGGEETADDARTVSVLTLEHADPNALIGALEKLLNGRQMATTRLVAGPDGSSLIVSGPPADVEAVRAVVPVLDKPRRVDRQVRLMQLALEDPADVVNRARALYEKQIDPADASLQIEVELDAATRLLTLIGSTEALERFTQSLRLVEQNLIVERETRQVELAHATPSQVVAPLSALARQLLQPRDGLTFTAPTVEAVDQLDLLIVTALPDQFGVIDSLIATLDRPGPGDYQFRVLPLSGVQDAQTLLERTDLAFARLTMGYEDGEIERPDAQLDALTGNLIVAGGSDAVRIYEQALNEARRLLPPARSGQMYALQQAQASAVAEALGELLVRTEPIDPAREVPAPSIDVIERTNSLYVVAEPVQHQVIQRYVRELDTFEQTELPPMRLIQVRAADAQQLSTMLRQRYASRPAEARREQPVEVTADAATNTLIVTAHQDVYDEIKAFVDEVNLSGEDRADRETMIFPLKLARATDLATALEKLYPEPPMPVDRRGRPLPHLREPREVYVSADAATNTLIIEAPAERQASFEALVQRLDRVELPPTAELRTYHIERGDPNAIARTLNDLARRGVMADQPSDGSKPVEVLIQAEPLSKTLIVAGDEVTFAKTEEILDDLKAVPVRRRLQVFEFAGADLQDIADRAQALYREQTAGIPDAGDVSVEIDRESGVLLVVADDEGMVHFAGILNQLRETIGPPPDVRLVPLEYAKAAEVVGFLRDLSESHLAMVGGRGGPPPTFEPIERTNSILVAAQPQQHEIIRSLIRSLDTAERAEMPPLRILQLRTADAQNLADALNRQYAQRPVEERNARPLTISADPQTNALMVAAHPDLLPEVEAIVQDLNDTTRLDSEGREIRIFPLKIARAEELARTIDEMYPDPPMPLDRRGRPMPHLRQPREVVVRADSQTNALIVDAPVQRMAGFEKLVEQLDRQKIAEETEVRTWEIVHADLNQLATTLRQLAASGTLTAGGSDRRVPITIATEPVSRTLIVSGPREIFDQVEQLLTELDVKRTGPATTLRFFKLEHARAESVARMLREILLSRMDQEVPDAGADIEALLNVTADVKTNTLIISAPAAIMPVAEQLIEQLDDSTASIGDPVVRVKPLTFADASEVSRSLTQALPNMISKATGEPLAVRIIASPGSNALILVGLEKDLEEVEQLIEPLDLRPATDAIDARTFKLEYADANAIAPIVEDVLTDQQATDPRIVYERIRRSRGAISIEPRIRVEADERTNSLIVSGPQQTVALAQALIEQLDQADESSEKTYRTFTPVNADPQRLADTVRRVIESTRPTGKRARLDLIPEPQSGAIVIIGREAETTEAVALLEQWDRDALTAPPMDLRIVRLTHTDASTVARAVAPLLADRTRWPEKLRTIARSGVAVSQPTVTADPAANRLLISAPTELMPVAVRLVGELDQPRTAVESLDLRIFGLTQAKAADVANAIRTAMDARAANRPGEPKVGISPEPSSNAVIVTATPTQLAEIESIITKLDDATAGDRAQVRTVFLQHARAENLVPIVEELLASESLLSVQDVPVWMRVQVAQEINRQRQATPDIRVMADPRLNAIVISAPVAILNLAEEMIAQLDIDPSAIDGTSLRTVRVLTVENADARELAANLEAIFAQDDQAETPPTIRVDTASNSLIVRATQRQFETIEQVAGRIDQATIATSRQMQMIPIDPSRASAGDVARTLQRLLDRGGGSKVEVITVEELLEKRRQSSEEPGDDASSRLTPRPLWQVLTATAFATLQVPASSELIERIGGGDGEITIAVDRETNSIVVIGSPRAIERVTALAEQLQDQIPPAPSTIRYIALPEEVDARTVANLVSQTLAQMTPAAGRRGDLRRRSSIVADPVTNALIVASNDIDFETIGDLVAALSQPPATDRMVVKIYPLETITAERAENSVRDLVGLDQRGRQARRMRRLAVDLMGGDGARVQAVFEPGRINLSSDAQSNSLIVMAPGDAIEFIERYIELIDQTPVNVQSTLKLYPLKYADAGELSRTLRGIFQARFRSMQQQIGRGAIQPEFSADDRTNTLLITASPEQLTEVDGLLEQLDRKLGDELQPLRIIELTAASPTTAATLLERVVLGDDQQRRTSTLIVPDNDSGVLMVRAPEEISREIDRVLAEIDRRPTSEFKVRTIVLERANASAVATALQRFFDDRAKIASEGRGRRSRGRQVSIIGDENSSTLLIAANDTDYAEIEKLVQQFDTAQAAKSLEFRVYQLQHAKATEIENTVQNLVNDLTWGQGPFFFFNGRFQGPGGGAQGTVAVRADARLNALIVTGQGDKFDVVENLIEVLDAPVGESSQRLVKLYRVEHAPLDVVSEILTELFADPTRQRRWWEPPDPTEVRIRSDARSNTLIISALPSEHDEIGRLIDSIDSQTAPQEQQVQVLAVEFARATELANTLSRFLADRAEALNAPEPSATIIASDSANSLVVSANDEDFATIRDLLTRLDSPDVSGDRVIEIIVLEDGDAGEIERIIREQFGRKTGQAVVVTADVRTNSLIVNAPKQQFAQVKALVDQLDAPDAADETIIRTYALDGARAADAVRILSESLALDARGRTTGQAFKLEDSDADPVEVKARIVADRRSNSLIVTATAESFPVIESLISKLDEVPAASPVEWRIIPLEHALAVDVSFTLRQFLRRLDTDGPTPTIDYNQLENQLIVSATADQFEQVNKLLDQIDRPSKTQRLTEFVPLQFAEAEKIREALAYFYGALAPGAERPEQLNTQIVANPATNSLLVSADEQEWENIRALLAELDSEEYDSSLQLRVLPLVYADARSVAQAINNAFAGTIERGRRDEIDRQRSRRDGDQDRRDPAVPSVLVEADEWVRASAEPLTNSVIVSASRLNIRKIEQIVEQLDVADFAKLPPPQIIPVASGNPEQLAESLAQLYVQDEDTRGRKSLRIVGDIASNTIIVRAEEAEFAQIRALADALQQEASSSGLTVHVLRLTAAPARRVASAINEAYRAKAQQSSQPLSIQVDPQTNSLVIASTGGLYEEIATTVRQLDEMMPAAGQGIFIIELEHVSPEAARSVIETIGLDKPQPEDSISRLVSEPIKVSELRGRNALIIVANPADRDTIVGLVKALDAEPALAEARVRVVRLKTADAEAVAEIIRQMLTPGEQQAQTPLAEAVQEQVRRLSVRRDGAREDDLDLDLTKPVRVIADAGTNSLILSSTPGNVAVLEELARMFDALPITDAVTVQIFPLENIAADQFARIVREIFDQGKELGRVPGGEVEGVPAGVMGKALLDEIAMSVDERTNTVVVAGKEEAVALVDVLSQRLDGEVAIGWVEPRVIQLRYADANDLAETIQAILVEGAQNLPQSTPLQRQIGRLRMARVKENGGRVLESDVFQPMTRLVIRPEPQLNALVLVGTPMNLEVVAELVVLLDIEAASPDATVRIYPIVHASAARLAQTIKQLFDEQAQTKAIRPEDRVIVQADDRTNALIVTTSHRSFAVLEGLLDTLDSEIAPDLKAIRRIEIENASASRLAALIQQLMDARLERLRKVQPETADLEKATIVADPRTNSLVVAAGNESFEVIRQIAADLDRADLEDVSLIHIISLEYSNVDRVAEIINSIMDRRYAELPAELRASQKPLVMTDPRTTSLLIAANPEDFQAIETLVAKIEAAPTNPAIGLHVIPLSASVRAEQLAQRIQRIMREREQSLGPASKPSDRVSVEPDPASNSLIVASNDENLEAIMGLVQMLTVAETESIEGREIEILTLRTSRATDIVSLLQDLYVQEANRARGANTVRVTADDRLNAVVVNAPTSDVAEIRKLVAQLDGARPATVLEIKYIPLRSANALETVSLIENVLSGRGIGSRRSSQQATVVRYLREIAREQTGDESGDLTEMEVSAAVRESITLTPDLRTNTVIVTAPRESIDMIERMIRDLDESNIGSKSIRIFKLTNADAEAMAEILTDLFNLRQGRQNLVLRPREDLEPAVEGMAPAAPPAEGGGIVFGLGGTELTAVPDERQQLSITVDNRTNSLLVSGTPRYLDLVEEVVTELDSVEANEREVFVYHLRNAEAAEVARVISGFVENEQRKLISTLSADELGSRARLLEREVTIEGDDKSNTVLVSASPRYMQQVKDMIEQLDVDPPQVLIQVLLAEVTLDAGDEWGVDFNITRREGDVNLSAGFGLASAFVTGMGVPELAIAGTDFDLLIRALQSQGRVQVLSNPSVMVANNEPARIQVGETIQIIDETRVTDAGNISSTTKSEDTGVILEVTPSINPDGFVRMAIKPEISTLSAETTQISEDFDAPIITRRTADTTVTVYDGQTVVLGGLIADRFERREQKVPLLGDIPIIGALFRQHTEDERRTELLIVITPYVVDSPAEVERMNDITSVEIDRLTVPEEIKEAIRENIRKGTGGLYDAEGNRLEIRDRGVGQQKREQP